MHTQPTFAPPSTSVREDLGISLDDFRLLQEMQTREITPEDYELLMLLHSKSATQTLTQTALAQVTQVFRSDRMHADACAICLAPMGSGEELSRLACPGGHIFHEKCIAEWLTSASRCCPVDKHDLSAAASCSPCDRP